MKVMAASANAVKGQDRSCGQRHRGDGAPSHAVPDRVDEAFDALRRGATARA
jgi:hypothetical protein